MADIFLSYSREDRAAIEPLVEQIVAAGYSVWWDRQLTGGGRFLKETEAELDAAKVVLVVWSKTSIESHWVADEAGAGRDTGRLLPISLDGSIPPLGFRQFQVIDFAKWTYDDGLALKGLFAALGKISAPSGTVSEPSPSAATNARRVVSLIRRPFVLGAIALAGAAVIAVVVSNTVSKSDVEIQNHRAAFFGFTASDDNPLANQVAIAATDETYTTLTALAVETAARSETQGVELNRQMTTALSLGARYGMAGTVRTQGDSVTVSIRLDDTKSRATFWQATLIGDTSQIKALPIQAAARSTNLLHCITKLGAGLEPADSRKLGIASRACDSGSSYDRDTALRWRELVNVAPKSAHAHIGLARSLLLLSAEVPESERSEVMAELSDAVSRALTLDANNVEGRVRLAILKIAEGRSLSEFAKDLDDASALAVKTVDRRGASVATTIKMLLLQSVGQGAKGLPESRSVRQGDPLYPTTPLAYAQALAAVGQLDEGVKVLEEANARLQDRLVWQTLVPYAFMVDADRALRAIDERPPTARNETAACWRQVIEALKIGDLRLRRTAFAQLPTCNLQGMALSTYLMLDDLDGAFAFLRHRQDRTNPLEFLRSTQSVFLEPVRKLRADPRFLSLMKDRGTYQYWLDSGTHPDVCDSPEERDFPVCVELRKDQGK